VLTSVAYPCHFGVDPDSDLRIHVLADGSRSRFGYGPAIFIIDLQDANKKLEKRKFFCILLFEGTFTSFFKDKKSKRVHTTVEIKVFLTNIFV
jgi:hypothetical protein